MAAAYAKILLFGEHIVLQGAEALAMPWTAFSGQWAWDADASQQELPQFANYLQELQQQDSLLTPLDMVAFQQDLQQGLYFDSNIPNGYGAGSSGALCAALYKTYQTAPAPSDLVLLREQLAQLESFFHGASSGTDPLICYLEQAIHIVPGQGIRAFDWNWKDYPDLHFFVIDTGIQRQTAPWVAAFKVKAEDKLFKAQMKDILIPASNQAIQALLQGQNEVLFRAFSQISALHYLNLKDFIPPAFHQLWKTGLNNDQYMLKLCGAGGGGFILGMSRNRQTIRQIAKAYNILPIR
ncbi:MAG TPA: hypothetical protein VJ953_20170 [Saprospiraceae bacterium]|nr:hypothetical protein [Saprospiraceae bacterium]